MNIDLRYNKIENINLFNIENFPNIRNESLQLGHNPINCDCHLLNFLQFTVTKTDNIQQNYAKVIIDDLYCNSPRWAANKSLIKLSSKDLKCNWSPMNVKDACSDTCTCWEFPEERIIVANCTYRHLHEMPILVGNHYNWTVELDLTGNQINRVPSLNSDEFKNIEVLILAHNNISSVAVDVFSHSLQVLNDSIAQ